MEELKTKEDLLYFMQKGILRISRSDLKFIVNLQIITNTKKYVTSNQNILLDKIILKYDRQLTKHGLHVHKLILLPWLATIIDSAPQYTSAFISIEEGMIYFKSPYNSQFITKLRIQPNSYLFKWNVASKRYEGTYSTSALKMIIDISYQHFDVVNHCSETLRLLNNIIKYNDTLCWTPTLVSVNGNLIIAGINSHLADVIKDVNLSNNATTFAILACYGISIHPSLLQTDAKLFASSHAPKVEMNNISNLVVWLTEIGCDYAYVSGGNSLSKIIKKLINELHENMIPTSIISYREKPVNIDQFKFPVFIRFTRTTNIEVNPRKIAKLITIVNSEPIDIK
jgi:hypothetical protein